VLKNIASLCPFPAPCARNATCLALKAPGVGGHTIRIDDSPPSLSSSNMPKKCILDDAIEPKRIIEFMKLQQQKRNTRK
jgi:hypothetical protein